MQLMIVELQGWHRFLVLTHFAQIIAMQTGRRSIVAENLTSSLQTVDVICYKARFKILPLPLGSKMETNPMRLAHKRKVQAKLQKRIKAIVANLATVKIEHACATTSTTCALKAPFCKQN